MRAADEDLLDVGLRDPRDPADGRAFDRSIAPAEHAQAFFAHDPLDDAFALQTRMRLDRQKHHPDAVLAGRRQREAELAALPREELVRNLDEHARAIAGLRIAAASAAVRQVDQNLNALDDDVVGLMALDVSDEADPAGIVLVARIVKTLSWR